MHKDKNNQINNRIIDCISCALMGGEIETIGGTIASTEYFSAQQDYSVPIIGFIIISSKRHIQSIDEFTCDERKDFIEFLYKVRKSMREALDVETVYIIQEEDTSHFHIWLFPNYVWMKQFGKKIKSVDPIMQWAKGNLWTKENLQKVQEATESVRKLMCCKQMAIEDILLEEEYEKRF